MGCVSRHIFKWFGLSLILLNDGEQLYSGFRNTFTMPLAWEAFFFFVFYFFFPVLSDNISITFLGSKTSHPRPTLSFR